jgi:hypothetical protein
VRGARSQDLKELDCFCEALRTAMLDWQGHSHGALLACDPDFDALRRTPRFRQIARSVGADV